MSTHNVEIDYMTLIGYLGCKCGFIFCHIKYLSYKTKLFGLFCVAFQEAAQLPNIDTQKAIRENEEREVL